MFLVTIDWDRSHPSVRRIPMQINLILGYFKTSWLCAGLSVKLKFSKKKKWLTQRPLWRSESILILNHENLYCFNVIYKMVMALIGIKSHQKIDLDDYREHFAILVYNFQAECICMHHWKCTWSCCITWHGIFVCCIQVFKQAIAVTHLQLCLNENILLHWQWNPL